jgi:prepilin-type N-terminal cleavage/methylation domain-containing protein
MKKAFTLIEILISVAIISLMVFLVYGSLDDLRKREQIAQNNDQTRIKKKELVKLFYEDILEKRDTIEIEKSRDNNTILHLVTGNIYHDKRYTYVIYKMTNKNNLIRIELPKKPAIKNGKKEQLLYDRAYVDRVLENIEGFRAYLGKDKKSILIEIKKDGQRIVLNI